MGFNGPLVSSAMVSDYGLRGTFGLDYDVNPCNTVGVFYQTRMDFQFSNAVTHRQQLMLNADITAGDRRAGICQPQPDATAICCLPPTSTTNSGTMCRSIDDIFVNQWAFALGTQLTRGKKKYRLGYSYNTNPGNHGVGGTSGRLPRRPGRGPTVPGLQHGRDQPAPDHRRHRPEGFLVPSLDLDLFAGPTARPRRVWRLASLCGGVLCRSGTDLEIWGRNGSL